MNKPVLALTIGDVCGIGPEIIVKAFASGKIFKYCNPVVIGKAHPLKQAIKSYRHCNGTPIDWCSMPKASEPLKINKIRDIKEAGFKRGAIDLIEIEEVKLGEFARAKGGAGSAELAIKAIRKAVSMALRGGVHGIVTLPINKKGLEKAGLPFPGHTEFLAYLTKIKEFAMCLIGGGIRVILVTRHIPLKDVSKFIKKREILKNIMFGNAACKSLGISHPRIAVAGLNPHAGEQGLLGNEETKEIIPAVKKARARGIKVSGPYPADSLFYHANKGKFDMVVAMYHDQGLIPLKMNYFEKSVNVTLGLPIIRTSPGHGTAYDIAGKGIAKETSFLEAVKIAAILAKNRR